jgi:hypothetical protein
MSYDKSNGILKIPSIYEQRDFNIIVYFVLYKTPLSMNLLYYKIFEVHL